MNSQTAHYGPNLSLHLNIPEEHEHHDEAVALYERLKDPEQFRRIRQYKTDLGMDHERLDIFIEDTRVEGSQFQAWGVCESRSDHFMKGIYLMPGGWPDDDQPLRTLAHEMLHAAFATSVGGWVAALNGMGGNATDDPARMLAAATIATLERGEEKLVLTLNELLWTRLLP